MIYLGTDIIEVNRIRNNLKENQVKFLNRIFTESEIKYCNSKSDPAIHFSGKFAGKEAIKKALLSSRVLDQIAMKNIEIISEEDAPTVYLSDQFSSLLKNDFTIKVSISHTDNTAIATAIMISKINQQ